MKKTVAFLVLLAQSVSWAASAAPILELKNISGPGNTK